MIVVNDANPLEPGYIYDDFDENKKDCVLFLSLALLDWWLWMRIR